MSLQWWLILCLERKSFDLTWATLFWAQSTCTLNSRQVLRSKMAAPVIIDTNAYAQPSSYGMSSVSKPISRIPGSLWSLSQIRVEVSRETAKTIDVLVSILSFIGCVYVYWKNNPVIFRINRKRKGKWIICIFGICMTEGLYPAGGIKMDQAVVLLKPSVSKP